MRQNVDTDLIIRIERLVSGKRTDLGPYCFESLRFKADGSTDTDCILNRPPYDRASILLAGANFGCGSSREHAVWALMDLGYRCVIAPSFGEIFFNNCFQNGMLPICLPMESVQSIADDVAIDPGRRLMEVDLLATTVTAASGVKMNFDIDPLQRQSLLEGEDQVALSLRHHAEISAFQARDRLRRPWVYFLPS
jgi:3-isopropylmalate/(R)-2-methylmalate dehydratase small subunit